MKNEMRLQGIGLVEGTPAGELKVGDITRWNNGFIERVTSVEFSKTGKTVVVGIEYISYSNVPHGELKQSERTFRASRLVNIIGSGNTVLVSDTRFETAEEVVQAEEAPVAHEWEADIDPKTGEIILTNRFGTHEFKEYEEVSILVIDEEGNEKRYDSIKCLGILGGRMVFVINKQQVSFLLSEIANAPAVKEFTIYSKNDVRIVTTPNGEFALTIGQRFNVDYKDEHGEYFIENLLFMGSGPANDCLLFKNERGDILHMEPLKVQRVTIPFPFKTEREKLKEQNKVDLFKRYHELLQKALIPNNITDEEREEMIMLYEEVKDDISELAYAAFSKGGVQ